MNFSRSGSGASAGLVIRTKEVELLSVRGKSVASRVRVPIDGDTEQHVIQAIQQALSTAGLKTKRLAVSITSRDVLFRFFTIPAMPKTEWDSAVQFEARKYIPFKTESLVWDYRAKPSTTSDQQLEVIFSAIPKDTFVQVQEVLASAGVQPTILEPTSLSLARLIDPAKGASPNEFVCLVDVEQEVAHLAIVKDQMPHLTRDISLLHSAQLPEAGGGPGSAEAGTVPPQAGPVAAPGDGGEVERRSAVDPQAERLLSELSVSMDFFMREHPSTTIPLVMLFGDETVVGPWGRWLAERLHCAVELGTGIVESRIQGGLPLSFASALGLLQATKSPPGARLDFLKRSAVKSSVAPPPASAVAASGALASLKSPRVTASVGLAAGALGVLWFAGTLLAASEQRQLSQTIRSRPDVGWGLHQMTKKDLDPIKEKADQQLTSLKQMMNQRVSLAAKLDALARALPDGMWLTGFTFENRPGAAGTVSQLRLVISGACFLGGTGQELSVIQQFEEEMKHNATFFKGFSTAQLDQIDARVGGADRQQQYTYRTFQLNCNSERPL